MKEKTKDILWYICTNLILITIAVITIFIIYFRYNSNKEEIIEEYGKQANVIVSVIQAEKVATNKEKDENTYIYEIPIINETEDSEGLLSNNNYKYFYYQLDENAKMIYDTIEENIENMKTGLYTIDLPDKVANTLYESEDTSVLEQEFQSAWDALSLDRVDLFYIDVPKVNLVIQKTTHFSKTTYKLSLKPQEDYDYLCNGFENEETVNSALIQLKNKKNEILNSIDNGSTYEILLQIHDYLVDQITYSEENGDNAYSIYGALVQNQAVCEGYAEALKYILDEIGIPCVLVSGKATNSEGRTENHEWNYVKIEGKWYAIDVTWDDPIIKGTGILTNGIKHKYFLKGSSTMQKDHFPNGIVSDNGIEFEYPNIEKEDY